MIKYGILVIAILTLSGCATSGIESASGATPAYYAGISNPVLSIQQPGWKQWYDANQPGIKEIWAKTDAIKLGKMKPSCIDSNIYTCVATLAQTLAVSDDYLTSQLFSAPQRDINGKRITKLPLMLSGFLKEKSLFGNAITFDIRVDVNNNVKSLAATLPRDPTSAKTFQEYNGTGIYELMYPLAVNHCPDITRDDIYKFFENKIKPKLVLRKVGVTFDGDGSTDGAEARHTVSYCGRKITFAQAYGYASSNITLNNTSGSFGGLVLIYQ